MCGIVGIVNLKPGPSPMVGYINTAVKQLAQRGPDSEGVFKNGQVALAHRRLSILDTSNAGKQPMSDPSGRYTIVFNGEIYNFKPIRKELQDKGYSFYSDSDTEVLLQAYAAWGMHTMLQKLNGFFAFAIYDAETGDLSIARDRMGIKPLLYYRDGNSIVFASEMKAVMAFPLKLEIDKTSLAQYLHLNYIPQPFSIFKSVSYLPAGHWMQIKSNGAIKEEAFYEIPYEGSSTNSSSYEAQQEQLLHLMEESVKDRMIADVPLGAFLSGGIDSSAIVALASKHTSQLNTFSIGYSSDKFYDETEYAQLVAKKYNTNHTVFSLSHDDLFAHFHETLDYIDEPFADSSALVVNILSRETRKHVTVALSGDGGDELFAGYNKHMAELRARDTGLATTAVKSLEPVWALMPKSRNSKWGNRFRQFHRFAEGAKMKAADRYWRWCGYTSASEYLGLLSPDFLTGENMRAEYVKRKQFLTACIKNGGALTDTLLADCQMVLSGDMLRKVDLMSMANSLEVRVPFLDHRVVEFAFGLPDESKINKQMKKRIVQDAFRQLLPAELYNRPKQGFEVPLLPWLKGGLKTMVCDDLLARDFVAEQGIFNVVETERLKQQLYSNDPGDAVARVYGLLVFQYWWKKWFANR